MKGGGHRVSTVRSLTSCSCWPLLGCKPDELEQFRHSRHIDHQLQRDKQLARRRVKLLLLGTGESGKSTFLKQMRIIHGLSFDPDALDQYRRVVYDNTVRGMRVLLDARDKLNIFWGDEGNAALGEHLMRLDVSVLVETAVFSDLVPILRELWLDAGIQQAFSRRYEYQLADSVKYFLDSLDRIGCRDYVPTNQDVLMARKATKGATEFTITVNNIPFMFVDVGGQRSQRQKWFLCFENVTSILFLVSSCEFDEVLLEDRRTNRLDESCNVFDTIVNSCIFSNTSIIVFFNKTDLLREKLMRPDVDISRIYPDFQGDPHCLQHVQEFLLHKFMSLRRPPAAVLSSPSSASTSTSAAVSPGVRTTSVSMRGCSGDGAFQSRPLFHHYTTAIDTKNITVVFNAVKDTILQRNLQSLLLQ